MVSNNIPSIDELQEKVLYDIIQYLPLNEINLRNGNNIDKCIELIESEKIMSEAGRNAIAENLPAVKAILKDRPELGKAKISNMSWKDNDGDGKPDYSVYSMQACTFELDDHIYVSFRGTPKGAWLDNGQAYGRDSDIWDTMSTIVSTTRDMLEITCPVVYTPPIPNNPIKEKVKKFTSDIENKIEKSVVNSLKSIIGKEEDIFDYMSKDQELAVKYGNDIRKPRDGSQSIFDKGKKVYVTGHSKGGNAAMVFTLFNSDKVDRCISACGQGFSPEFITMVKEMLGEEVLNEVGSKTYGYGGDNDYVNIWGVHFMPPENRLYYIPYIPHEKMSDIIYNHYPIGMVDEETGKPAELTVRGPVGNFLAAFNEEWMDMDIEDRRSVGVTIMWFAQRFHAKSGPDSENDSFREEIDAIVNMPKGFSLSLPRLIKLLGRKEGKDLIRYLDSEFKQKNAVVEDLNALYDMDEELADRISRINDILKDPIKDIENLLRESISKMVEGQQMLIDAYFEMEMAMYNPSKFEVYGTADLGTVAINYSKTRELVSMLDEANDLVERRLAPEMEDISDRLKSLSFVSVNTRDWDDILRSIKKANDKRKRLKERIIGYYNTCESMESRFVSSMNGVN